MISEADTDRDLQTLLADAEQAGPVHRIEWRDRIAAHGRPAIEAIAPWLREPALAAFAIRVIERAGHEGERDVALRVLRGARRRIDPGPRPDLDWALLHLRPTTRATVTVVAAPARPVRLAPVERPYGVAGPMRPSGRSAGSRRPGQS
jgi:hypothetical protein